MAEREFRAGTGEDQPDASELEVDRVRDEPATAHPERPTDTEASAIFPPVGPGTDPPPDQ